MTSPRLSWPASRGGRGALIVVIGGVIGLAVVLGTPRLGEAAPEVGVFEVAGGWGYRVTVEGGPTIRQPHVPAVAGIAPFASREDALRTGRLVAERLANGQSPTVTPDDLARLGVAP